ncbi:MAG: response regulator [Alphaproteobacteria bacterium]|nr:response regulator [Alphaproteobacteria bacterium]
MPLNQVSALILDDNAHMRGLVRVILAGFGCRRIEEASDCPSALNMVASGDVDIAFVDMKLGGPGQDGLEFCRSVRTSPTSPNVYLPIIMLTAYSERNRVLGAINAGVDEFLVKPVRAVDLANRVNAVIDRRRPFVKCGNYFGPDRRRRDDPRHKGPWRRANDPSTVDI